MAPGRSERHRDEPTSRGGSADEATKRWAHICGALALGHGLAPRKGRIMPVIHTWLYKFDHAA